MIDALVGYASRMWPEWFPGRGAPPLEPVILSGGPAHRSRLLLFLIPWRGARPEVVLKVAFTPEEAAYLSNEFRALSGVGEAVPSALKETFPKALGLLPSNGMLAIALRALEGRTLLVPDVTRPGSTVGRRLMRSFFRRSFDWSASLARATAEPSPSAEEDLAGVAERFVEAFSLSDRAAREGRAFARAVARAGLRWFPGWQHGDITVGNVLNRGGRLRFVDWEHGGPGSEPWFDIAYAPGAVTLLGRRQANLDSVRESALRVLAPGGWVGNILREEMDRAWHHPLPLGWAVTLTSMRAGLRRRRDGRLGWMDWVEFVSCLLADEEWRTDLAWLAPEW